MLTSVVGSLRIELSAAFSMTGANTCPIRSSLVAWAIAVGKTRPITAAKRSGSSTTPVSRDNVSISRPTSKVRSCSSCRSRGCTPFRSARSSGFRLSAISTSRLASAFRSMASSPEGERSSPSRISGEVLTSRR